jgi:hypothetical protein
MNLFDMMGGTGETADTDEAETADTDELPDDAESEDAEACDGDGTRDKPESVAVKADYAPDEAYRERDVTKPKSANTVAAMPPETPKPQVDNDDYPTLRQISETEFVDRNGEIYEVTEAVPPVETARPVETVPPVVAKPAEVPCEDMEAETLSKLVGDTLIARCV